MNRFVFFVLMLCLMFFSVCYAGETPEIKTLPYNYLSVQSVPIKLSIAEEFTTKEPLNEGDTLKFIVRKDVYYNGKSIVKAGDIINGRIETIITAGMNGFPAEIIVDDFEIPGIKSTQMQSTYIKKGQNRCFWVYPLKWALTPIPFVGSLTNFIKGGHARIKTKDIITIYYYPEWL